jgi:Zn-dependent protease with chaperone function
MRGMARGSPVILALETDSVWLLVLAVSVATLPMAVLIRRLIGRVGGLSSGIVLIAPLALPVVAAVAFRPDPLPEISVLEPVLPILSQGSTEFFHLLLLTYATAKIVTPYAISESIGHPLLVVGVTISGFMVVRRVLGHIGVRRILRRCRCLDPQAEEHVAQAVASLAAAAGLRHSPTVLMMVGGGIGPFTVGVRNARIVLSEEVVATLTDAELEGVLAHEIAHIKMYDFGLVIAASILRDFTAWNPMAHFSYRGLLRDREYEADKRAVAITGKPLAIASGLLKVRDLLSRGMYGRNVAMSFLPPRTDVGRRISHLIALADHAPPAKAAVPGAYLAASCLLAVLALLVGSRVMQPDGPALALMIGSPPAGSAALWVPPRDEWAVKQRRAQHKGSQAQRRSRLSLPNDQAGLRPMHLRQSVKHATALRRRDLPTFVNKLTALAERQGMSPATVQGETMRSWQAVPLLSGNPVGTLGIYRMQRLSVDQGSGGVPLTD